MMEYVRKQCLFCDRPEECEGNGNLKLLYPQNFKEEQLNAGVFSARRTTEHFHYKMVRCGRTGLVFSQEVLPDEILLTLYSESKVTFKEFTDLIRKDYWRPIRSFVGALVKERALEIGCSNGFFLEELSENGYESVYGCEPSFEAKEAARPDIKQNIHASFFKAGLYPDSFFDLICSFQTLDHVSDPLETVRVCYRMLKPGGHAYFITHDIRGFQAKLFGEKSPIIDVEHIYLFNKKTLAMLGERAGFKKIDVFDIRNSYPLRYWLRMAPIPLKKVVTQFATLLGLSNAIISIKAGNIGVLLQKPKVV